jgi:hypothetical protein
MGRVPWKCWSPGEKEQGYVTLVALVDRLPVAHHTNKRSRGRPHVYSDRLFLKALVVPLPAWPRPLFWAESLSESGLSIYDQASLK